MLKHNKKISSELPKMDSKIAIQCLSDMKDVFDDNDIKFWLEAGTLLGAIREGGFIPWDGDIDLGIFEESIRDRSIRKKLSEELSKKGFIVQYFWNVMNIDRDNININIQLIYNKGDKAVGKRMKCNNSIVRFLIRTHRLAAIEYYGDFYYNPKENKRHLFKMNLYKMLNMLPKPLKRSIYFAPQLILSPFQKITSYHIEVPKTIYLKSETINFYNLRLNIPQSPKKYLRMKYGDEWAEPPKKWHPKEWYMYGDWHKISETPTFYPTT
jgi:phosphorylcholine metabolism protein LicD